jgi:Fe-S cluster assembly iron-binding protein IscA
MIITQKAEEKIKELLNKEEYLRVKIAGGGCSGYRIGLEKETNREADGSGNCLCDECGCGRDDTIERRQHAYSS